MNKQTKHLDLNNVKIFPSLIVPNHYNLQVKRDSGEFVDIYLSKQELFEILKYLKLELKITLVGDKCFTL